MLGWVGLGVTVTYVHMTVLKAFISLFLAEKLPKSFFFALKIVGNVSKKNILSHFLSKKLMTALAT